MNRYKRLIIKNRCERTRQICGLCGSVRLPFLRWLFVWRDGVAALYGAENGQKTALVRGLHIAAFGGGVTSPNSQKSNTIQSLIIEV